MCRSSARSKARRSSRSCPSKTADLQENPPRLRVTWSDAEPCHMQALSPAPVDPRPPRTGAGGPGFPVTNRLHDLPGREDAHPGWPDAVGPIHRCSTCPCLARGPFCRKVPLQRRMSRISKSCSNSGHLQAPAAGRGGPIRATGQIHPQIPGIPNRLSTLPQQGVVFCLLYQKCPSFCCPIRNKNRNILLFICFLSIYPRFSRLNG